MNPGSVVIYNQRKGMAFNALLMGSDGKNADIVYLAPDAYDRMRVKRANVPLAAIIMPRGAPGPEMPTEATEPPPVDAPICEIPDLPGPEPGSPAEAGTQGEGLTHVVELTRKGLINANKTFGPVKFGKPSKLADAPIDMNTEKQPSLPDDEGKAIETKPRAVKKTAAKKAKVKARPKS